MANKYGDNIQSIHLDANESLFFERELEFVKSQTYDKRYPNLLAASGQIIPINTNVPEWARTITYQSYDSYGKGKIGKASVDDAPMANAAGKEYTGPVRDIIQGYTYTVDDIMEAQATGKRLDQRLAMAARKMNDIALDDVAMYGDTVYGLKGLLSGNAVTEIPEATASNGDAGTPQWSTKTADEIIADLNQIYSAIRVATLDTSKCNLIILPIAQDEIITSTPRSSYSDVTIKDFWLRTHPGVRIISYNKLDSVSAFSDVDVAVGMEQDPMNMVLEVPMMYSQLPAEARNYAFVINTRSKVGGLTIPYPKTAYILKSI